MYMIRDFMLYRISFYRINRYDFMNILDLLGFKPYHHIFLGWISYYLITLEKYKKDRGQLLHQSSIFVPMNIMIISFLI